jgi:hypothetical protein
MYPGRTIKKECDNCVSAFHCWMRNEGRLNICNSYKYDEQRFGRLREESHWFWGGADRLVDERGRTDSEKLKHCEGCTRDCSYYDYPHKCPYYNMQ